MKCDECGAELEVGSYPFCPHGKGSQMVESDDIPGGMWIENLGPVPVKVYSHTERLAIMRSRGLNEYVRHMGVPGSDKSPHTTNWDVGPSKDGRPMAMLTPEEQAERRAEAADRLGLTVDELERLDRGERIAPIIIPNPEDIDPDARRMVIEMSGERDGGEYARDTVKHFNVTADTQEMLSIVEMLNGKKS